MTSSGLTAVINNGEDNADSNNNNDDDDDGNNYGDHDYDNTVQETFLFVLAVYLMDCF